MRKRIIIYLLNLIFINAAVLGSIKAVAARTLEKGESQKVFVEKLCSLPHTEIEIVSQRVTAAGQTFLQKNLGSHFPGLPSFIYHNTQAYKIRYSNRAAGLFRENHLSLIFPFHYFW